MKIRYILIALISFLVACSDEMEREEDIQNNLKGDAEYGYLSVNVITPDAGTRDGFSVGSSSENKVTSLRFYFFDADLKAKAIKKDGTTTYIDVDVDDSQNDYNEANKGNNNNIESKVSTVLKLEPLADNTWPAYMAVVANLGNNAPTLGVDDNISSLQQITGDYTSQNPFVMSSAVYKADNKEQIAVSIEGKIKETQREAEEVAVNLYVERIVAKVTGNIDIETADGQSVTPISKTIENETFNIYKLSSGKVDKGAPNGSDIYVRFLGWNVTATANKARLVKKINTGWDNIMSGWDVSWNDATNHRSYWAINPAVSQIEGNFNFVNYTAVNKPFDATTCQYVLENAGKADNGNSAEIVTTKVIGAAQLVDQSGAPLTLVKWGGTIYNFGNTDEQNRVKGMWASYTRIYKQTGTNSWESIKAADLELEATTGPATADEAFASDAEPRYYSKLTLKDNENTKYAFYISGSGNDIVLDRGENNSGYEASAPEIIDALDRIGLIEYWNTGYTYYWFDIPHLGGDVTSQDGTVSAGTGKYGVVRNNWINFTVTSVDGLGVPVANPDKVIYPEDTEEEEESYLGVQFEILPWRYVDQGSTVLGK